MLHIIANNVIEAANGRYPDLRSCLAGVTGDVR